MDYFDGVRVIAIDLVSYDHSFRSSYERPEINTTFQRILRQEKPDVLHCCHLLNLGATVIAEAAKVNLPVILTLTDFYGICWTSWLMTRRGKPCDGPAPDGINCVADFYGSTFRPTNSKLVNLLLLFGQVFPQVWKWFGQWGNSHAARNLCPPVRDIQLRKDRIWKYVQHVDRFIVATDYLKDAFIRNGYPAERFTKITFGITHPSEAERAALEDRYTIGKHGSPFVFGFIGQIAKHKGIDLLIKAFQKADLIEAELHIYGDLNQERRIKKFVLAACNSTPRIKCLGTFPGAEIYQKLSSIHTLCVPSIWAENAPLVLLNALASKTHVIVSDGKGLSEFVQDDVNGTVFKNKNVKSLEQALRRAYSQRVVLGEKMRSQSGYTLSPQGYAHQVSQIYEDILEKKAVVCANSTTPVMGTGLEKR